MKVLNEKLDKITILHMPGITTMPKFKEVIESQKNNLIIKDDDISIIIIATKNYIKDSTVIHQLNFNNIKYYNGAQNLDESEWTNSLKIKHIYADLLKIRTTYTLILDARDTLICDHLSRSFINKFKKLNAKIVFNASAFRHPSYIKLKGMDDRYKANLDTKPYLNSGVVFGETFALLNLYSATNNVYEQYDYLYKGEQLLVKTAIINAGLKDIVALDANDTIFKCVHQSTDKPDFLLVREFDNYIISNNIIKSYKGRRFRKKLRLKLGKAKLVLYPNSKNHYDDVMKFYNTYKKAKH